jgi:hypothetical protein
MHEIAYITRAAGGKIQASYHMMAQQKPSVSRPCMPKSTTCIEVQRAFAFEHIETYED